MQMESCVDKRIIDIYSGGLKMSSYECQTSPLSRDNANSFGMIKY